MKLSRKSAALQRAIHKAIASGKALGGLLMGFAATVSGCREGNSPESTMGSYPAPAHLQNATNETQNQITLPGSQSKPAETNATREKKRRAVLMGKYPASNDPNEKD